jgi:hypothetical protein
MFWGRRQRYNTLPTLPNPLKGKKPGPESSLTVATWPWFQGQEPVLAVVVLAALVLHLALPGVDRKSRVGEGKEPEGVAQDAAGVTTVTEAGWSAPLEAIR